MMIPAQGPTTSLQEDLSILGIGQETKPVTKPVTEGAAAPDAKVKQTKQDDSKGGDYAGPPGDKNPKDPGGDVDLQGDEAAGHYTYVPVRGDENVGPDGKYGKSRGGAKNENVEEVRGGKMIPGFLVAPTPSEAEIAEAEEKRVEEAAASQLNRAWEVINAYFGEDDDGLNDEGLRGVINAMGHALNVAVEDIRMLSGENVRLTEAVNDLNRLLKESEDSLDEGKMPPEFLAKLKGEKPAAKDDDKDADEDDKDDDKDEEKGKKPAFGGKQALPFGKKEESKKGANLQEDANLNSILAEVAAIGGSAKKQALTAQSKLIEGFESVLESASEITNRIVKVIREDEKLSEDEEIDLPADDERLTVAQYFNGIAEDAQGYLTRLADGDTSFRVAEEDLNRLRADIQKGVDAMHKIPA
jgi:hypothetical protein